jgi:hypothetical protein
VCRTSHSIPPTPRILQSTDSILRIEGKCNVTTYLSAPQHRTDETAGQAKVPIRLRLRKAQEEVDEDGLHILIGIEIGNGILRDIFAVGRKVTSE